MTASRQDAWNHDEDIFLAEVVLRHIREGGTQLKAFEEVGKKLNRTSAACGFRWNSAVRKIYQSAIEMAKEQRKATKKQQKEQGIKNEIKESESFLLYKKEGELGDSVKKVIDFLSHIYSTHQEQTAKDNQSEKLEETIDQLEQENEQLKQEIDRLSNDIQLIESDYKSLLEIMDRARKLADGAEKSAKRSSTLQVDPKLKASKT